MKMTVKKERMEMKSFLLQSALEEEQKENIARKEQENYEYGNYCREVKIQDRVAAHEGKLKLLAVALYMDLITSNEFFDYMENGMQAKS